MASSLADDTVPTWAAYNSLITGPMNQTTCQGLPLLPASPTDWSNLYTALKLVQGINVSVADHPRTIVTLDLQLYAKCIQLRENKKVSENFIFRLGELHTVFAMLKVLGKYISESGIDRLFLEAGIYGPTTLGQIMDGKHMKRGIEAYSTMYLAISSFYIKTALENNEVDWLTIKEDLQNTSKSLQSTDTRRVERKSIHP